LDDNGAGNYDDILNAERRLQEDSPSVYFVLAVTLSRPSLEAGDPVHWREIITILMIIVIQIILSSYTSVHCLTEYY